MLQASHSLAYVVSTWIIPLVVAITFHEAAHGFVAHLLGDNTAWKLGRVSFNPLKHIDPFGTILLPALLLLMRSPFLFGYAKPVPVNFRAVSQPGCTTDMREPANKSLITDVSRLAPTVARSSI